MWAGFVPKVAETIAAVQTRSAPRSVGIIDRVTEHGYNAALGIEVDRIASRLSGSSAGWALALKARD